MISALEVRIDAKLFSSFFAMLQQSCGAASAFVSALLVAVIEFSYESALKSIDHEPKGRLVRTEKPAAADY